MFRVKTSRYNFQKTTLKDLEEDPFKMTKSCQMTVAIDKPKNGVSLGLQGLDGIRIQKLRQFYKNGQNLSL